MSTVVLAERRGPIGLITLNRPEVLNAIDDEVMQRFAEIMSAFKLDAEVRSVIITGQGRGFSTGADMRSLHGASAEKRDEFMACSHQMMASIEELPKPVIAAVNGVAAGGGFEIMLACDFSIAVQSARIGLTEIRYGFLPGGGGTQRLAHWVGPSLAKRLIWSGELLSAQQAMDYGLVAKVINEAELIKEAELIAMKLAERSPQALAWGKRLVRTSLDRPLSEGLLEERKANVELLSSPEALAAINRFINRGSS